MLLSMLLAMLLDMLLAIILAMLLCMLLGMLLTMLLAMLLSTFDNKPIPYLHNWEWPQKGEVAPAGQPTDTAPLDESDVTIVDWQGCMAGQRCGLRLVGQHRLGDNAHDRFAKRKALRAPRRTLTDWVWLYEEENAREEAIAEAERAGALVLC